MFVLLWLVLSLMSGGILVCMWVGVIVCLWCFIRVVNCLFMWWSVSFDVVLCGFLVLLICCFCLLWLVCVNLWMRFFWVGWLLWFFWLWVFWGWLRVWVFCWLVCSVFLLWFWVGIWLRMCVGLVLWLSCVYCLVVVCLCWEWCFLRWVVLIFCCLMNMNGWVWWMCLRIDFLWFVLMLSLCRWLCCGSLFSLIWWEWFLCFVFGWWDVLWCCWSVGMFCLICGYCIGVRCFFLLLWRMMIVFWSCSLSFFFLLWCVIGRLLCLMVVLFCVCDGWLRWYFCWGWLERVGVICILVVFLLMCLLFLGRMWWLMCVRCSIVRLSILMMLLFICVGWMSLFCFWVCFCIFGLLVILIWLLRWRCSVLIVCLLFFWVGLWMWCVVGCCWWSCCCSVWILIVFVLLLFVSVKVCCLLVIVGVFCDWLWWSWCVVDFCLSFMVVIGSVLFWWRLLWGCGLIMLFLVRCMLVLLWCWMIIGLICSERGLFWIVCLMLWLWVDVCIVILFLGLMRFFRVLFRFIVVCLRLFCFLVEILMCSFLMRMSLCGLVCIFVWSIFLWCVLGFFLSMWLLILRILLYEWCGDDGLMEVGIVIWFDCLGFICDYGCGWCFLFCWYWVGVFVCFVCWWMGCGWGCYWYGLV